MLYRKGVIMNLFAEYFLYYCIFFSLFFLPAYLFLHFFNRKKNIKEKIFLSIFLSSVLTMAVLSFISRITVGWEDSVHLRIIFHSGNVFEIFNKGIKYNRYNIVKSINYIPFVDYFKTGLSPLALTDILGNYAVFVPIGLFGFKLHRAKGFAVMFTFIAAKEALQFLIGGVADINDIIFSALGLLTGTGIFILLERNQIIKC